MNSGNWFGMENPIWNALGKICDAAWLTVLWVIGSVPLVTIGASSTAACYVALKIVKDEEGSVTKQFFASYRQNLKQSVVIWLILLLFTGVLGVNLWFYYQVDTAFGKIFMVVLLVLLFVLLMIAHYIFAVTAKFSNTIKNLFILAFLFAMKNFGWTLFMIVASVCVFTVCIFICAPLLIFSIGALALLDAWIMNPVFDKFAAEIERDSDRDMALEQ